MRAGTIGSCFVQRTLYGIVHITYQIIYMRPVQAPSIQRGLSAPKRGLILCVEMQYAGTSTGTRLFTDALLWIHLEGVDLAALALCAAKMDLKDRNWRRRMPFASLRRACVVTLISSSFSWLLSPCCGFIWRAW